MKKILSLILLCTLVLGLFAACGGDDEGVTQEEAIQIALTELGVKEKDSEIHAHTGIQNEVPVYNIYVTVGSDSHVVTINAVTGDVLYVGESSHSH